MKVIDHDNWLQADAGGRRDAADVRAWRQAFLSIRLASGVPDDVVRLFELARGGMLYSYFFQPLLITGVEQCYRALELGARVRCARLGHDIACVDRDGKAHPLSFGHNLGVLARYGLIQEADMQLWRQARELRDWVADPANQMALTREHGATALSRAAELLARLFRS
jgi:hypothetical protein